MIGEYGCKKEFPSEKIFVCPFKNQIKDGWGMMQNSTNGCTFYG